MIRSIVGAAACVALKAASKSIRLAERAKAEVTGKPSSHLVSQGVELVGKGCREVGQKGLRATLQEPWSFNW
ncbi:MAG: hypothetical protein L0Z50_27710 [Verrucomicrobiales bacterium]|nr:hypothetical protein [Verrucomicrobiales bacterium]